MIEDDVPLNVETIEGLKEAINDIRHRRLYSEEEIMAGFGIR